MTVLIIHGSPRKQGCSSNIARKITDILNPDKLLEIDLQKENLPYCKGCLNCVYKGIEYCPHSEQTLSFKEKILEADTIIIAAPVYILHMSGQLKTFIDHYPSMFLIHRPEKKMYNKQLIVIATAAGPVFKQTLKEIKECFTFFGISRIYKLGVAVQAENYKKIKPKKMQEIDTKIDRIIKKVKRNEKSKKVSIKIRAWFYISRIMQNKVRTSDADYDYWDKNNWFKKERPWQ